MGFNKENIRVGAGSDFAWGNKGITVPQTVGGALDTGFKDFGGVNDEGVELNRSADWEAYKLWQSLGNILYVLQGTELTIAQTLAEWNEHTIGLYLGTGPVGWVETTEGSGVARLDIDAQPERDERTFLWRWKRGPYNWKMVVPDGSMTDQDGVNIVRTAINELTCTISANDSGTGKLAYILTDDPQFLPEG